MNALLVYGMHKAATMYGMLFRDVTSFHIAHTSDFVPPFEAQGSPTSVSLQTHIPYCDVPRHHIENSSYLMDSRVSNAHSLPHRQGTFPGQLSFFSVRTFSRTC